MIALSFIALIKKQEKSLYFIWCILEKDLVILILLMIVILLWQVKKKTV